MSAVFHNLWLFRGFILGTVKREFQSRYLNSLLGVAWTIIQPLAMILVYTLIFSQLMRARLPGVEGIFGYSIYLCAGLLTWGLFTEIVSRCQNIFLENANLMKKLSFPRLCLPVVAVTSSCLNFAIIFGLFTVFLLLSGNFPGWPFIALIPVLLVQILFAVSLGITAGILNVFFRDVGQLLGVVLQFWFWLTPIVYPINILPEKLQALMQLNPMAGLMAAYQTILARGQWPDWSGVMPTLALGILFTLAGLHLYRKRAAEMVDEL